MLDIEGYNASVATAQFCHYSTKATDNMYVIMVVRIKVYFWILKFLIS